MSQNNNKKVDLLGFQKSLNEQFLAIFESKKAGKTLNLDSRSNLGLLTTVAGFNFFLPLKELKNVSMTGAFEDLKLSQSWLCGFNQIRGEVYTILDLNKIFDLFINKKTDNLPRKMENENRIVYLKSYNDSKVGVIIDSLLIEYSAEYTPILKFKNTEKTFFWEVEEDIEFNLFVKKDSMSHEEYQLINQFYDYSKEKRVFEKQQLEIDAKDFNNKDLFFSLVSEIYLDSMGKKPIFTLNIENLTKILINVSPF